MSPKTLGRPLPVRAAAETAADVIDWLRLVAGRSEMWLREELLRYRALGDLVCLALDGDEPGEFMHAVEVVLHGRPVPERLAWALRDLAWAFDEGRLNLDSLGWAADAAAILDGPYGPDAPPVCELHAMLRAFAKQTPQTAVDELERRIEQ